MEAHFERRYYSALASESIDIRLYLWGTAIENFAATENPFKWLFGHGIGSFGYLLNGTDSRGYPHNIFLEILYEFGFIGFVFSLALTAMTISRNLREVTPKLIKLLDWQYLHFYYFLIISLTIGDLMTNFMIFVFLIIIWSRPSETKSRDVR